MTPHLKGLTEITSVSEKCRKVSTLISSSLFHVKCAEVHKILLIVKDSNSRWARRCSNSLDIWKILTFYWVKTCFVTSLYFAIVTVSKFQTLHSLNFAFVSSMYSMLPINGRYMDIFSLTWCSSCHMSINC